MSLLAGLLLSGLSQAEAVNPNYIYSWQITGRFKMTEVSPYKDIYPLAMRYLMMGLEFNNSDSRFCTIGYNLLDEQQQKHRETIVFWDKGQLIIRWQAEDFDLSDDTLKAVTLMQSPSISYKAVRPRASITPWTSSGQVKEDVDAMRTDCKRNGEVITIKTFPTPKACDINIASFDCVEKLLAL